MAVAGSWDSRWFSAVLDGSGLFDIVVVCSVLPCELIFRDVP